MNLAVFKIHIANPFLFKKTKATKQNKTILGLKLSGFQRKKFLRVSFYIF